MSAVDAADSADGADAIDRGRAAGAAAGEDSGARVAIDGSALVERVRAWGRELGFGAIGIADLDVAASSARLAAWLADGRHGTMDYMAHHAPLRAEPSRLLPGALRAITARMDYLPPATGDDWLARESARLHEGEAAVVSVYARGRDYHKVLRQRLQTLASRIEAAVGPFGYRVCTDSAPVFEVELARKSGIGWRGKHTLLLSREAGSMFFLGEILTDLPLPVDAPTDDHCGSCTRCLDVCPTGAITAPYEVDARRCISYLTIEHDGSIPEPLRPLMGNRVYGCDDCQLVCPWNKFARTATLPDFDVRHGLDAATLVALFGWSDAQFQQRHAGSAIRRIGHERWLRNIAVALGNAPTRPAVLDALRARRDDPSALVREHVAWALARHGEAGARSAA
jgi:epoxyqueuosine reductase